MNVANQTWENGFWLVPMHIYEELSKIQQEWHDLGRTRHILKNLSNELISFRWAFKKVIKRLNGIWKLKYFDQFSQRKIFSFLAIVCFEWKNNYLQKFWEKVEIDSVKARLLPKYVSKLFVLFDWECKYYLNFDDKQCLITT